MKKVLGTAAGLSGRSPAWIAVACAVGVLVVDYFTGSKIRFPLVFVVPVAIASWHERKWLAISLALLMPATRIAFHFPWHETQSLPQAVLNGVVSAASLLLYCFLVSRTAWQTKALESRVNILEGILPICAWCKQIRNEQGAYEALESYIAEHSEASFTHGICPECAAKMRADEL